MTDLIKEKLLKDLKKYKKEDGTMAYDEYGTDLGIYDWGRIITILEAKLQQHEETSKAKDEKFIKILDKLIKKIENADEQIEFDEWETFMIFNIQEIKQRIKEK